MIENLKQAIKLARGAGKCDYLNNGKPYCVIAQLYVLEGGSVEDLKEWEGCTITGIDDRGCLKKYPIKLLDGLQSRWDGDIDPDYHKKTTDERRADMIDLVEYYEENPHLFK